MEFIGSVNSTQIYCSQKTWSTVTAEKKKKKKKKKEKRVKLKTTQPWIISIQTHSIRRFCSQPYDTSHQLP